MEFLGFPTFWGGDLLQKIGNILSDRAVEAQAFEKWSSFLHGSMKADLPAAVHSIREISPVECKLSAAGNHQLALTFATGACRVAGVFMA